MLQLLRFKAHCIVMVSYINFFSSTCLNCFAKLGLVKKEHKYHG
jgi:hypothetical protein